MARGALILPADLVNDLAAEDACGIKSIVDDKEQNVAARTESTSKAKLHAAADQTARVVKAIVGKSERRQSYTVKYTLTWQDEFRRQRQFLWFSLKVSLIGMFWVAGASSLMILFTLMIGSQRSPLSQDALDAREKDFELLAFFMFESVLLMLTIGLSTSWNHFDWILPIRILLLVVSWVILLAVSGFQSDSRIFEYRFVSGFYIASFLVISLIRKMDRIPSIKSLLRRFIVSASAMGLCFLCPIYLFLSTFVGKSTTVFVDILIMGFFVPSLHVSGRHLGDMIATKIQKSSRNVKEDELYSEQRAFRILSLDIFLTPPVRVVLLLSSSRSSFIGSILVSFALDLCQVIITLRFRQLTNFMTKEHLTAMVVHNEIGEKLSLVICCAFSIQAWTGSIQEILLRCCFMLILNQIAHIMKEFICFMRGYPVTVISPPTLPRWPWLALTLVCAISHMHMYFIYYFFVVS